MRSISCSAALALFFSPALLLALEIPFTVLHTNDLHSHFEGNGPDGYVGVEGKDALVTGNYARLTTLIKSIREEKSKTGEPVLLVDAGDFFSGTLFHALAPSEKTGLAPELEFFVHNKYDAVTLGNHEFDAGPTGFIRMVNKGAQLGVNFLLATNLAPLNPTSELSTALTHIASTLIKTVSVGRGNGLESLRVGFIGFLGCDAARSSAGTRQGISFVGYDDIKSKAELGKLKVLAQAKAKFLRDQQGAQVVIALIHGGDPEDSELAKTDGIDVVISGHTHELYSTPKMVDNKVVAQAGSYGRYLGKLELSYDGQKVVLKNPKTSNVAINSEIKTDTQYLLKVAGYKKELTEAIGHLGYDYNSPIATIAKTVLRGLEPNNQLGILVTTAIRGELNRHLKDPVDIYFTSASLVRESLVAVEGKPTPYQFSDVFRLLPMGFGENLSVGSPIKTFYLAKKDLWRLINFLEVYRHISANFTTAYSDSFTYRIREWGVPFVNRLAEVKLHGKPYSEWPEFVQLATNSYVASFFDKLPAMSKGWLTLVPRDKQGNPISSPLTPGVPPEPALFADALRRGK